MLQIICLNPSLEKSLISLFAEIQANGDTKFFHPHPFTEVEAKHLCNYQGQDLYYALCVEQHILGYGMLRGWDEGYTIPSLGIYIHSDARGNGLGKLLMLHLHSAARLQGATRIRLKVHLANQAAKVVYEGLGYVFQEREGEQIIGYYELT